MKYVAVLHVFNEEEHLEQVLTAIHYQTHPPELIFIVDDGSTDNTPEIIHNTGFPHSHRAPNPKLKKFKRRAMAFNEAVDNARSLCKIAEFVLKVDGDTDLIDPEYAEKLMRHMKTQVIAACSGVSTEYFKTRDLNNGAVLYRLRTLPRAKEIYGWDREIQLELIRAGYMFYVDTEASYTDLRPPNVMNPSLGRVVKNRANTTLSKLIGKARRKRDE